MSLWSHALFKNFIIGILAGAALGYYLHESGISADRHKLTSSSFSSLFHIGCSVLSLVFIVLIPSRRKPVRNIRTFGEFYDEAVFVGRLHICIPSCGLMVAMSFRVLKFTWKWLYAIYARLTNPNHKAPPIFG
jgi:hypothetical protein